ncbi:MAG: hypothetical protein ACLQVM_14385 [Terriglobia bacterium]
MPNGNEPEDIKFKLYALLVEQLHKYVAIFWQFPLALLAANFVALDRFLRHPKIMLLVSLVDCVFVFAFHRLVINARSIITATRNAEEILSATGYDAFIPKFRPPKTPAPKVTVWTLWVLAIGLVVFSAIRCFCS